MKGTRVMSVEEYRAAVGQPGAKPAVGVMPASTTKYRNTPMLFEGVRYHSKAELRFEMRLRLLKAAGRVAWWVRQVPFALPGDANTARAKVYRLDFLVVMVPKAIYFQPMETIKPETKPAFMDSPLPRLVDVKGVLTKEAAVKISVIQATHHVEVELVKPDEVETWA